MNVLRQFIPQKINNIIYVVFLLCTIGITNTYALEKTNLPVEITADTVSFDNKTGVATYLGNVHVVQGARNLYANKLSIHRDTNNQIKVMVASGTPAEFTTEVNDNKPGGHGCAQTIKYYPQQDIVDLYGDARLSKNGDEIKGPKLSYNFATEILRGDSSHKQRTTVILKSKRAQ